MIFATSGSHPTFGGLSVISSTGPKAFTYLEHFALNFFARTFLFG